MTARERGGRTPREREARERLQAAFLETDKGRALARVQAALERLPILEDKRFKVDTVARQLVFCGGTAFAELDSPNNHEAGSARALDSLEKFARLASALEAHLASMPSEAVEALEAEISATTAQRLALVHPSLSLDTPLIWTRLLNSPADLAGKLATYAECARDGKGRIAESPSRKGARCKKRALAVTRLSAAVYEDLTGLPVSRASRNVAVNKHQKGQKAYGPFLDLLSDVFAALEVKASPEGQVKALHEEQRKNMASQDQKIP